MFNETDVKNLQQTKCIGIIRYSSALAFCNSKE